AGGNLSIVAPAGEVDAIVNAATVSGPFQRTAQSQPKGGSLTIGLPGATGTAIQPNAVVIDQHVAAPDDQFVGGNVTGTFRDTATPTPNRARDVQHQLTADQQQTLHLSADVIDKAQYRNITINSGDGGAKIGEDATLEVAPGGSINLNTQ